MANEEYARYEEKMDKVIERLAVNFSGMRAGRASTAILDKVQVEYYGVPTPINQVSNITVPDARTIAIQPWDAALVKDVEKALLASDIGITPNSDGKVIRLSFPQLTEERRKELTKVTKKYAEEARVAVRVVRRDAVEDYKAMKKTSEITEDDLADAEKDIQKLTDKKIEEIDKVLAAKDKEIMEI